MHDDLAQNDRRPPPRRATGRSGSAPAWILGLLAILAAGGTAAAAPAGPGPHACGCGMDCSGKPCCCGPGEPATPAPPPLPPTPARPREDAPRAVAEPGPDRPESGPCLCDAPCRTPGRPAAPAGAGATGESALPVMPTSGRGPDAGRPVASASRALMSSDPDPVPQPPPEAVSQVR